MAGYSTSAPTAPEAVDPRTVDGAPPRETRAARVRRRTHRAGLRLAALTAVVLVVILVALTAANTRQVKLDWLIGSGTASLVWIVLVAALLGGAIGVVVSAMLRWRTRAPRR
jgi:uncharacterized integral membrane protein